MQSLVFTAESTYARFRCPHTTTSALTFSTIHPIAVKGLIGAILGIDYKALYDYTLDMKIGIQVLNPVYKDTQAFNLIAQTNNNNAANFQSRIQFLRDVRYKIFVYEKPENLDLLKQVLLSREYTFTPYLGCSEYIAKLNYEDTYIMDKSIANTTDTVIPQTYAELEYKDNTVFYFDRIPIKNNTNREYTRYSKVVFSIGTLIQVSECQLYKVGDQNVFFF